MPSTRPSAPVSRLISRASSPCTVPSRRRTAHARRGCPSVASRSRLCTRSYVCTRPRAGRASMSTPVGPCQTIVETLNVDTPRTGFTRRIVGVPKAESDVVLAFLFAQIAENHDFHVRYKWDPNDIAIWDNRVSPPLPPFPFLSFFFFFSFGGRS